MDIGALEVVVLALGGVVLTSVLWRWMQERTAREQARQLRPVSQARMRKLWVVDERNED